MENNNVIQSTDKKQYQLEYRQKNKEKYLEYQRKYRQENQDKIIELRKNVPKESQHKYCKKYRNKIKDSKKSENLNNTVETSNAITIAN